MKPGPNLKQRSRGRNNNGGGGKKHMAPRNQTYDSNGPDIRIRGNAHQVLEKYLTLARDAASQGDRIATENYYQHAEHYFRVINSQNQANGRPNERPLPTPADDQMAMAGGYDDEEGEGEGQDEAGEDAVVEQTTHHEPVAEVQAAAPEAEEQPAAEAAPPRRRRQPRERAERTERPERSEEQGEAAEA
jgi:hypothetical protein